MLKNGAVEGQKKKGRVSNGRRFFNITGCRRVKEKYVHDKPEVTV